MVKYYSPLIDTKLNIYLSLSSQGQIPPYVARARPARLCFIRDAVADTAGASGQLRVSRAVA